MRQDLLELAVPMKGACEDAAMGSDKAALILIKHCRDMKQQETRLRLITLLLVLSCTVLFCFTISVFFVQNAGHIGQKSADESSPAYSKQRQCPAVDQEIKPQRWHISVSSVPESNTSDGQYIKWKVLFGETYNEEKRAIVIPKTGVYFVHVKIQLSCDSKKAADFIVDLRSWNKGYEKERLLSQTRDGLVCSPGLSRTVVVGELLDLLEGDHVSVWIPQGYKQIYRSSFGAFFV